MWTSNRRGSVAGLGPAAAVVACAVWVHAACGGATKTWDGSCGGTSWHAVCGGTMTNWMRDGLPMSTDDVSIPMGSPIVLIGQPAFASSISCETGLTIDNSVLALGAGGGSITNLSMVSTFSEIEFAVPGTILSLDGTATWTFGTIDGTGSVWNFGTCNPAISPSAMTLSLINNAQFVNGGGADATLRFVSINGGCEVVNQSGGTLTLRADNLGGFVNGGGVLTNVGDLVFDFPISSSKPVNAFVNQTGGQMIVQGVPNVNNVLFNNAGNFSGGTMTINDGCNVRFQHPGAELLPYVFDGMTSISGNGNLFVQIPNFAPATADWQVIEPLEVNLTGTSGLVLDGNRTTFGAELTNLGNARWVAGTLRRTACDPCSPALINESASFAINALPSVRLDVPFINNGTVTQEDGNLLLDDDGVFINNGVYQLQADDIRRIAPNVTGVFVNAGIVEVPQTGVFRTITAKFRHIAGAQLHVEDDLEFFFDALQLEGGSTQIGAGGLLELVGGTPTAVADSVSEITGNGRVKMASNAIFNAELDSVVRFNLPVAPGVEVLNATLGGSGLFENVGEFSTNSNSIIGISGVGAFANLGTLRMHGISINGANAVVLNAPGGTVHITSSCSFVNQGTFWNQGDCFVEPNNAQNLTMTDATGKILNDAKGIIHVKGPAVSATVTVQPSFNNVGTVIVEGLVTLFVNNPAEVVAGELVGGTWICNGGILRFPGQTISTIGADAHVRGESDSLPDFSVAANEGTVEAIGPLSSPTRIQNDGTLKAAPGPITTPSTITNGGGSVLSFSDETLVLGAVQGPVQTGYVCTSFNNFDMGVVRPGGPDAAGAFHVDGDFNQSAGGTLQIELGGLAPVSAHDQLIINGDVSLDGILDVSVLPGYEPEGGEQYTIITTSGGGTITGDFDAITGAGEYSVRVSATSVVLTLITPPPPPCLGDLVTSATFQPPPDGEVDAADLAIMLGEWGANPGSDADIVTSATFQPPPDGVVNAADLAFLLGAWGACR